MKSIHLYKDILIFSLILPNKSYLLFRPNKADKMCIFKRTRHGGKQAYHICTNNFELVEKVLFAFFIFCSSLENKKQT